MTSQHFQNRQPELESLHSGGSQEALEIHARELILLLLETDPGKQQELDAQIRGVVESLSKNEEEQLLLVISRKAFQEQCADEAIQRYPQVEREELQKRSEHISAKVACAVMDRVLRADTESLEAAISLKDGAELHNTNLLVREELDGLMARRMALASDLSGAPKEEKDLCSLDKCLQCDKGAAQRREVESVEKLGDYFERLFTELPELDRESLERDKYTYGAKGANLLALVSAVRALEPFFERVLPRVAVPSFTLIPTEVFRWHEAGEDVSELLREAYDWMGGRQVLVRSSAVHSEDGEHLGAGIYESFLLLPNPSFENFVGAVLAVYNSLSAPMAVKYRDSLGLASREEMGVVVQEFVEVGERDPAGHINTVRPRIPAVIDVVCQKRHVPIFRVGGLNQIENIDATVIPFHKERLMLDILKPRKLLEPAMIFPEDYTKDFRGFKAAMLARVGLLVEQYFKEPLQIEYVFQGGSVSLVQARPLPETWTAPAQAEFPTRHDCLWEGRSLGVMNEELDILGESLDNHEKRGVVIFDSAFQASLDISRLERLLPKEGAVVVLEESGEMAGHIESRCLERVLTIISPFADRGKISSCGSFDRLSQAYGHHIKDVFDRTGAEGPAVLDPNEKLSKLLVVSTGLEGRLYPAG